MTELRRGLPPLPDRIKKLPLDARGYPIPWFVCTLEDGTRDFRIADGEKRVRALRERLCWVCGEKLGAYLCFVVGPMCVINRNTSEPPNHRDCAEFAATACPFMTRPKADYREANLPEGAKRIPHGIGGNPGACAIYITRDFKPYKVDGNFLIRLGEPVKVLWFCEGRPATRADILESIERRIPVLREMAKEESPAAEAALAREVDRTMALLPAA